MVARPAPMMAPPMMPRGPVLAPRFAAAPVMPAPVLGPVMGMGPRFGQAGAPVLQQSGPMAGSYGSTVGADGTYWEKVSGPTAMGDTIATSIICKRKLPTRVVNPIVNVPVPVPVAVPHGCETAPVKHGARYKNTAPGRWIH